MLFHDVKWKIKTKKTTNRRHEQLTHLAWTCRRTLNPTCRVNLGTEASRTPMHPMISTGRTQMALSDCFRGAEGRWYQQPGQGREPRHAGWFEVLSGSDESWEWQAIVRRAADDTESGQRASVWLSRQGKVSESVLLYCRTITLLHQTHWQCTKWQSKGTVAFTLDLRNFTYEIHFNWNLEFIVRRHIGFKFTKLTNQNLVWNWLPCGLCITIHYWQLIIVHFCHDISSKFQ